MGWERDMDEYQSREQADAKHRATTARLEALCLAILAELRGIREDIAKMRGKKSE